MGAQGRKCDINKNAANPDLTVSTDAVLSNVQPAESKTQVKSIVGEGDANTSVPMEVCKNTLCENKDEVEPMKLILILRSSALWTPTLESPCWYDNSAKTVRLPK